MNGETNESTLRLPLSLRDWTFVFGLPTTRWDFLRADENGFCATFASFAEYREELLCHFERYIEPLIRCGLRVVRHPTASGYARLLRGRNAVILYTHNDKKRKCSEFRGGLIPFDNIVGRISPDFAGIAEICACEADPLQPLIRARAKRAAVRVWEAELSSTRWLERCAYLLASFQPGNLTYWDVSLATESKFRQ